MVGVVLQKDIHRQRSVKFAYSKSFDILFFSPDECPGHFLHTKIKTFHHPILRARDKECWFCQVEANLQENKILLTY